jgi:hypothetical protein
MIVPGAAAGANIMREIGVWRKVGRRVAFGRQVNDLHRLTRHPASFDWIGLFAAVALWPAHRRCIQHRRRLTLLLVKAPMKGADDFKSYKLRNGCRLAG